MNKKLLHEPDKLELMPLLERIYKLIEQRNDGLLSYEEMTEEINCLITRNESIRFFKKIKKYSLPEREMQLFLYVSHETINGDGATDLNQACSKIFSHTTMRFQIKRDLVKSKSNLIVHDLVKLQDGIFRNDREVLLTEKSLDLFLEDDVDVIQSSSNQVKGVISCPSIQKNKLFFNTKEKFSKSTI